VGAAELLRHAKEFTSIADAVADCSLVIGTTAGTNRELQHPLRPLADAAGKIRRALQDGNVALLFGSEKRGLANEDLSYCHWLLRIPTRTEHASMNLGQAVAICLYEIAREDTVAVCELTSRASAEKLERITKVLLETLTASDYVKPRTDSATEEKVRRMVRRMSLNEEDAETLTGMLRKMLGKMSR
jgi:TrmH family RNA methyltransferase